MNFRTGFMTSYFCDVISSSGLWRHIFVTSFLHRVYDVIFLWRHFFIGFMTSYFCDVISSSGLWRHIFVTSFLHRVYTYFCDVISSPGLWRHIFVTSFLLRVYDVIFLWRHFFIGFMTSYFVTSFLPRVYDIIFLYGVAEFFVAQRTNFQSSKQTKNAGGHEWELANALLHVCLTTCLFHILCKHILLVIFKQFYERPGEVSLSCAYGHSRHFFWHFPTTRRRSAAWSHFFRNSFLCEVYTFGIHVEKCMSRVVFLVNHAPLLSSS
jgi:hypothetical protein